MDSLAELGLGWLAYRALDRWPGILLIGLAVVGLIVLLRKHRLSVRHVLDLWAMAIITVCLLAGLWLFVRDEVRPAFAPPPEPSWWERITGG